jgi:hypothetical protein
MPPTRLYLLLALPLACTVGRSPDSGSSTAAIDHAQSQASIIYLAILKHFFETRKDTVLVYPAAQLKHLDHNTFPPPESPYIPSEWPDTLRQMAHQASTDTSYSGWPSLEDLSTVAASMGLKIVASDTTPWLPRNKPPPRFTISRPGFSTDSTLAIVRVSYVCGPLCGDGGTVVLVKAPGGQWSVWRYAVEWIS